MAPTVAVETEKQVIQKPSVAIINHHHHALLDICLSGLCCLYMLHIAVTTLKN